MSAEAIRIMCPNLSCRKVLAVPKNARGKTVRCRSCGTSIRVPAESVKPAAPAPGEQAPQSPPAEGGQASAPAA